MRSFLTEPGASRRVSFLASSMVGCGGDGSSGQDTRLAEELTRQLEDERLRHECDDTRHDAELVEADGDYHGAVLSWASTAMAAVILILLLARERRSRRVIERLLRLVLHRLRESRGPPYS